MRSEITTTMTTILTSCLEHESLDGRTTEARDSAGWRFKWAEDPMLNHIESRLVHIYAQARAGQDKPGKATQAPAKCAIDPMTSFICVTADPLPDAMPLYAWTSLEITFLIRITLVSFYVCNDSRMNHSGYPRAIGSCTMSQ